MSTITTREARLRRHRRVRGKVRGTAERPRLLVFRSNKGIFAQLVDDDSGRTLAGASWTGLPKSFKGDKTEQAAEVGKQLASASWTSLPASFKGDKTAQATEVGKRLAEAAKKAGVEAVVFDRGGYLFHGRVKALADGAREGGLRF